jgi:peptidoglycan hydrolase-like protein with peptidoglycan-binding domain
MDVHSPRRRRCAAAALAAVLTVSPIVVLVAPAGADAPATSITGLGPGARGDAVRQVQQALVNQGIPVAGGVDGVFGANTATALKQFQSAKGLPATGVVDEATALALGLARSALLGLAQGTRGDAVRALQERLVAAGITVAGGVDGVFGRGTKTALEEFQRARGLSVTGVVDAATAAALGSVTVTSPAPAAPNGAAPGSLVGLKIGARGDAVRELQRRLIGAGHPMVGGADGVFGVLTANALSAFQRSAGLKATGQADEATVNALSAAPAGGSSTPAPQAPSGAAPLVGLAYGSTGAAVKQLQEALVRAGVVVRGGADGVFGLATQRAVRDYQQAVGIAATGRVDEATANALTGGTRATEPPAGPTIVGLQPGSLGAAVKQLQEALIRAGVSVRGGADGIFGPATAQALRQFQGSQGLPATGVVDEATASALAAPRPANPAPNPVNPITSGNPSGGYAQFGEKGPRVVALQTALVRAGIALRGGVDGDFGSGTSAAVMDFQRARGLRVTGRVDDATAEQLGLARAEPPTAPDPAAVSITVFPVQGRCYFTDTWMAPRSGGRAHLGVDVIAPEGKLIYAVADGTITRTYTDHPGSLSGNGVRLTLGDGTYFFYAHMSSLAEGIGVGTKVRAGQVLGYVGSTGASMTNHLHFEVHPRGGAAVNPYPMIKAVDGCRRTEPLPQP